MLNAQYHAHSAPPRPAPRLRAVGGNHLSLLRGLADQAEDEECELAALMLRRAAALLAAEQRGTLFRLTYVSHPACDALDEPVLCRAILGIAQARNAAAGITGALMHSSNWFGQVLEGGLLEVETTFARIQRDTRHSDIRVLRMEPVKVREFGPFAMAEAGVAPDALLRHAAMLHQRLGGDTAPGLQRAAREIIDMLHTRIGPA